ncbi:MFS transporter, partial [Escherichia coli]|nr:MFS transporter [Escherichia coli]
AFLIDVTTEDLRDKISSYGFAVGYLGGVLMLVLNFALIFYAEKIGISQSLAVRISMLMASLWWGVFSVITFLLVKSRSPKKGNIRKRELVKIGFRELWL